jgi:hypothetical protein
LLAGLLLQSLLAAKAAAAGEPAAEIPVLLMLETATDPAGAARERRFVEELGMVLDGVSIRVERPADTEFADHALGDQIAHVRLLISKHDAVAATWLTEAAPDLLLLHLVVVSTGRALVRLVETRAQPGFEADLALAARELLGTAFLFDRPPQPATDPVGRVVESVREQAAPAPADAAPQPPQPLDRPRWALAAQFRLEGGIAGAAGPTLLPGGALVLERRLVAGLTGRLTIGVAGGPLGPRASDEEIRELALHPGLGISYLFDLGRASLGPVLEVETVLSKVTTKIEGGTRETFRSWRIRGGASLELRVTLAERVALMVAAGLAATPLQDVYRREITDKIMLASPYLSWTGRLGLVVSL